MSEEFIEVDGTRHLVEILKGILDMFELIAHYPVLGLTRAEALKKKVEELKLEVHHYCDDEE